MSVILSAISSGALAFWASKEKAKTQQAYAMVDTLRATPEFPVSGLQSLVSSLPHQDVKKLVFIRGVVLPRSFANVGSVDQVSSSSNAGVAALGSLESLIDMLRSRKTGQHAVVVEKTTMHVYNETSTNIMGYNEKQEGAKVISKDRKLVPFIIADHFSKPCNKYVVINLEGTNHQVPLEKVSSNKKEIFTRNNNGHELQIYEVIEEEILPMGNVVTAVGIFSSEHGIPTIKPFQDLPYFLTHKSKNELIAELSAELRSLTDKSELLSRWSVGFAGFAIGVFITRVLRHTMQ